MDPIQYSLKYKELRSTIDDKRYEDALRLCEEYELWGDLLHQSVFLGDLQLAEWALRQQVDVHSYSGGLTSFLRACQLGHEDLMKTILPHDLSQLRQRSRNSLWPNRNALMFAASVGNIPIAELLLSYGIDVNDRDGRGFTALMAAAEEGHGNMVELLLSKSGEVCWVDAAGQDVLRYAVIGGDVTAVELLLSCGMDINNPNFANRSIPLWTAISRNNPEMVAFLLSEGADPRWRSSFGEDASGYAERIKSTAPQIKELLRKNVDSM